MKNAQSAKECRTYTRLRTNTPERKTFRFRAVLKKQKPRRIVLFSLAIIILSVHLMNALSNTLLNDLMKAYDIRQRELHFRRVVRDCGAFDVRLPETNPKAIHDLEDVFESLTSVYILSTEDCVSSAFSSLTVTCVKGRELDRCITDHYDPEQNRGHGYLVSLSHAAIFVRALDHQEERVLIVEDDAIPTFLHQESSSLKKKLQADDWNIIRFSFRPYHIETAYAQSFMAGTSFVERIEKCPAECICEGGEQTGFCRLKHTGCDLRSSDFYAVHRRGFHNLVTRLLDTSNPHRVIDWFVLQNTEDSWLSLRAYSTQENLDIPSSLQIAFHDTYVNQCMQV